jgi:hypothetical protein
VAIIDFNFFTSEYVFCKNRYLCKNILPLSMFFANTAIYVTSTLSECKSQALKGEEFAHQVAVQGSLDGVNGSGFRVARRAVADVPGPTLATSRWHAHWGERWRCSKSGNITLEGSHLIMCPTHSYRLKLRSQWRGRREWSVRSYCQKTRCLSNKGKLGPSHTLILYELHKIVDPMIITNILQLHRNLHWNSWS